MAYLHKYEICAKETREILDNVLQIHDANYEFLKVSESIAFSASLEHTLKGKGQINELPKKARFASTEIKGLENYTPTHELLHGTDDPKESYEKKRGKRNYLEFRFDYNEF